MLTDDATREEQKRRFFTPRIDKAGDEEDREATAQYTERRTPETTERNAFLLQSLQLQEEGGNVQHDSGRGEQELEDSVIASDDEGEHEEEEPLERSLTRMLRYAPGFVGFDGHTTTYLFTTQLTHSSVVSTVATSRPFNLKRRHPQLQQQPLPNSNDNNNKSRNQENLSLSTSVYGQPFKPKKIRNQKGKYQVQLPAFRRSLPSLPIPVNRLNQELIQERNTFMARLRKERGEKALLENWAATKIQACYRGYRSRSRLITHQIRHVLNSLSTIRLDLSDMREHLERAEASHADPGSTSPWRQEIQHRAGRKFNLRSHKEQVYHAVTLIQACMKRFLARFGYVHLIARHCDEVYLKAVTKVQSIFRGFRLRNKIHRVVVKMQQHAVLQIQSLIRGIQARERVCILRFEKKAERRRLAGEPLQFTLPSRTRPIARTSPLRALYEHRKTPEQLEFKTPKWREEQMYLKIHVRCHTFYRTHHGFMKTDILWSVAENWLEQKVAVKLCINRSILQRRLLAEALSTPKKRKPAQHHSRKAEITVHGFSKAERLTKENENWAPPGHPLNQVVQQHQVAQKQSRAW
ncbi:hypothetical protein FI667_g804, partial [Globisporangium splendens]